MPYFYFILWYILIDSRIMRIMMIVRKQSTVLIWFAKYIVFPSFPGTCFFFVS
jgi:hypothetical protein